MHKEKVDGMAANWKGLGLWNLYFIAKMLLYWRGSLSFDVFYNLIFAAALLVPLSPRWLHRLRHLLALPVGAALFYSETWLPPISRLLAQPDILDFSFIYLLELAGRFINWDLVGAGFIVFVVYLYLSQWLRMTFFSVTALTGVALSGFVPISWHPGFDTAAKEPSAVIATASANEATPETAPRRVSMGKPSNERLNAELQTFYQSEALRSTKFPASNTAAPFDILFINICSLGWSDLEASQLAGHPLFKKMDVLFDDFNAATSYSGPAVLRLMRASCGQPAHADIYQPAPDQCYLLENLRQLGFATQTAMNHDGQFQGFLRELTSGGRFPQPFVPKSARPTMTGFDGSPIWNDYETLNMWWRKRIDSGGERTALLYNSISLHDGNREATADGGGRASPFDARARRLLDELSAFIDELENSKRKVVLVLIPEHGAAVKGDKMQFSGLREIPAPSITHIPVGIRVVGAKGRDASATQHIKGPTSYLALSELMSRLVAEHVFEQEKIDWESLTHGLPQTLPVSENEGTVVMPSDGRTYVRLDKRNWIEYPK